MSKNVDMTVELRVGDVVVARQTVLLVVPPKGVVANLSDHALENYVRHPAIRLLPTLAIGNLVDAAGLRKLLGELAE